MQKQKVVFVRYCQQFKRGMGMAMAIALVAVLGHESVARAATVTATVDRPTIALGESGDSSPASIARPAFMLIERDMASTMPPVTTRARRTSSVRNQPLTCSNRIAHSAEYSLR